MAHLLKREIGEVIAELQKLTPNDVEEGVSATVVFEFAKAHGFGAVCPRGRGGRAIALRIWEASLSLPS